MQMQDVSITSGNRHLAGRIFDSSSGSASRRAVLFIHGRGSSQTGYRHRAEVVSLSLDAICLTFDLSGHGGDAANFDRYSVYDHLEDVMAAYDHLASHGGVDRPKVGVSGASYGGYLAALLTGRRAVTRLILRAPTLAQDHNFPSGQQDQSISDRAPEGFDSLEILQRYAGDALIIESERDEIIPASHIAAYVHACPRAQHQVISNATHALTNPIWDEEFVNAVVSWFGHL